MRLSPARNTERNDTHHTRRFLDMRSITMRENHARPIYDSGRNARAVHHSSVMLRITRTPSRCHANGEPTQRTRQPLSILRPFPRTRGAAQ
jgi:hypothetical protein